jgi:hypothetical protein
MKPLASVVAVSIVVLGLVASPLHAATQPSKISAFGGSCPGSVTANASGVAYSGTTQGFFATSKTREIGTLRLTSTLTGGGSTIGWSEKYQFNKRALTYTLFTNGTGAVGSGTANISAHVITFSATFTVFSSVYTVQGTIRQTKHRIFVDEILSTSGSAATFDYVLRRTGKH